MGDRSQSKLYSMLLAFLDERGRSLEDNGSGERGLSLIDARAFLRLLSDNSVRVLGIEIWRDKDGWFSINGAEGWYCSRDSLPANHADALRYLEIIGAGTKDVFTIQFG